MLVRAGEREYPVRWLSQKPVVNGAPRLYVIDHWREEVLAWDGIPPSQRRSIISDAARTCLASAPATPPRLHYVSGCYRFALLPVIPDPAAAAG